MHPRCRLQDWDPEQMRSGRWFRCPVCTMSFLVQAKASFCRHMANMHGYPFPRGTLLCACGKTFSVERNRQEHYASGACEMVKQSPVYRLNRGLTPQDVQDLSDRFGSVKK